jgi:hypothetical protein
MLSTRLSTSCATPPVPRGASSIAGDRVSVGKADNDQQYAMVVEDDAFGSAVALPREITINDEVW